MIINSNFQEIKVSLDTIKKLFVEKNPSTQTLQNTFMERIELFSSGSFLLRLSHGDLIRMYDTTHRSEMQGIKWFILEIMYHALVQGEAVYQLTNIRTAPNLQYMPELGGSKECLPF